MQHKQQILEELGSFNKKNFGKTMECSPPKRIDEEKFKHPSEKSEKLPNQLRGKHYDAYWQICANLGCPRQSECRRIFLPFMKNFKKRD